MTAQPRHHLDKRAEQIAAEQADRPPDDLMTTGAVADWLHVSVQFLALGRNQGYGPPFVRIGPKVVMYRRADVLAWLKERTHRSTSEYAHPIPPGRPKKVA